MFNFKYFKKLFKPKVALALLSLVFGANLFAGEKGDSRVFWVHNFQFFAYDYRTAATLQSTGDHADFYLENAKVLSSVYDITNEELWIGTAHSGAFKRKINDDSWISVPGIPGHSDFGGITPINDMVILKNGTLLAGTDYGIYVYSPSLNKWKSTIVSDAVSDLLLTDNAVYAAISGYMWKDDIDGNGDIDIDMGVRSSVDGLTWLDISDGLPVDNDIENVRVSSLAYSAGKVFAATEFGVFQYDENLKYWQNSQRSLKVESPRATIPIYDSSIEEDKFVLGSYARNLVANKNIVSSEVSPFIAVIPSLDGEEDYSYWQVKLQDGVMGDVGSYFMELSANTKSVKNVAQAFGGYDTLKMENFIFQNERGVATI
ncbi:hypothetical protein KAJ27_03940, partial [bacterium]|nr:hypothetical protein [bacterium]